jgi:glutathione S-transferase
MTAPEILYPAQPIKLYRSPISGHSHRVELLLSLLGLPFERIDVNLAAKEQKSPDFLSLNPFGQIPVIQDGAVTLADSNSILVYLSQRYGGSQWFPQEPVQAACVQSWLSVAAGLLAFGPAAARAIVLFGRPFNVDEVRSRAQALFTVMEQVLQHHKFLVGDQVTLADIANYAYVARAPEGNISLDPFPHLRAWLSRIEVLPGFVPMLQTINVDTNS